MISRLISSREDTARIIISVISFLSSFVLVWGSLSLAKLSTTTAAQTIVNDSVVNQTVVTNYVVPVVQSISSPWLTGLSILILILSLLNGLDLFLLMLSKIQAEKEASKIKIDEFGFRRKI